MSRRNQLVIPLNLEKVVEVRQMSALKCYFFASLSILTNCITRLLRTEEKHIFLKN